MKLEPVGKEVEQLKAKLDQLCNQYKKVYGEEYDPRQEGFETRNP